MQMEVADIRACILLLALKVLQQAFGALLVISRGHHPKMVISFDSGEMFNEIHTMHTGITIKT